MKIRKNNPISFGITLLSAKRTGDTNTDPGKRRLTIRRPNATPEKTEQAAINDIALTRTKLPPQGKPFTPDMFNSEPRPLPAFPPPVKMSREEERVKKELERFRCQTEWHPSSKKSSSMALSVPWEFFKVVFAGVFVFFKYAFIAVSVIITVGCMICAGRQSTGLR